MRLARRGTALLALLCCALPAIAEESPWSGYLDYAYVFSSADEPALRARLEQYGSEAGIRLEDYVPVAFGDSALERSAEPEADLRRAAVAHLLLYLAQGDPVELDRAVERIGRLSDRLGRHENRYWTHYILAHRALERGRSADFARESLALWLHVVVPLETPYDNLRTLSLSDAPGSGFVSALPYVYENLARMILIRSPKMGIDRDLDPLAALLRLLYDGRVGAQPDVIPVELSARAYLERVVTRLEGDESDGGSLSFTLSLYQASRYHDEARARLAASGLDAGTVKAMRVASGAYEAALARARFHQGRAAVYTRVLQQLGEIYAAKQRLGQDPDIEMPFGIEGALRLYDTMWRDAERHADHGYARREDYHAALARLWQEIQETSLNAADYYLTRSVREPAFADEHARNAARAYARYLGHFVRYAAQPSRGAVPDSAYFAAFEAARGYGDALLRYTRGRVSDTEVDQAARRYVAALHLFPFDRQVWPGLASALERQGRENQYLDLARPVAERVNTSRHVDLWVQQGAPGAEEIARMRSAFSDSQALLYLGFAEEGTAAELRASLSALHARREAAERELLTLDEQRGALGRDGAGAPPAAPAYDGGGTRVDALQVEDLDRRIAQARLALLQIEKQIDARTRALPLFAATLGTESLVDELRANRDHPVHALLRRMYHENRD